MFGILEGATIPFVGSISEISHLGRAGPFTIQIRDHDSKSHFLMSRELPIQFTICVIFANLNRINVIDLVPIGQFVS